MYRVIGRSNDGLVDDIAVTLLADGRAAPNPFLSVVNPTGFFGAGSGWLTQNGQGPVQALSIYASCPYCTFFTNANSQSGNSSVAQSLGIPDDRVSEIDSGRRGLEISWFSFANQQMGDVILSVEFIDALGRRIAGGRSTSSELLTTESTAQRLFVPLLPRGTRSVEIVISTRFPAGMTGSLKAYWTGVTAQLVPSAKLPSSSTDLLTSIDGPLPGPSDTVRYSYDTSGNLTSVTNELGHVTRITSLDAGGRPLSITDPNGVVTSLAYDARGRLTVVNVNPGPSQARTVIAYDAIGQVTRVTGPDGSYLQYTWSDARRLASVSNNGGERIDYIHDAMGNVTSRTVKTGSGAIIRQQSALFDELGRLMRSIGAAGQQTLLSYDRTDNLTAVKDPRGGLFAFAYDGLQRLAATTDQTNAGITLTRDASDGITAYRDPRGLTTTYVRNGFGEVIEESGPDLGTTVIVRDERGLPTHITDPRGIVTNLTYDAAGRLVSETYPADPAQNVTYVYDDTTNGNKGVGRLTGIIDGSGRMARRYDALGRTVAEAREIAGKTYSTSYAYNAAGRLTAITYPSGRVVSYARNGLGRVTTITTKPSATAPVVTVASGFAWSPMSTSLNGFTHGNGLAATRAYDGDGRLTALRLANGTTRLMDLAYAYGDGMNLTAVNDKITAANAVSLAYDAAQRLATANGPWGSLAYAYTPVGDRLAETLTLPGGSPLVTQMTYAATSNRLSQASVAGITTRSFSYDAAGNTVTEVRGPETLSFAYNVRNRPVTVTRSGTSATQTSSYAFNVLEQMVQRSTNAPGGPAGTVHYIYGLDGELLAEADGTTGAITRDYIWLPVGDVSPAADNDNEEGAQTPPLPLGLVTGVNTPAPSLLMVHADHLGRPVRLTDATRATVWQASYDPFGQPWQITGAVEQNLRFPGQYFLLESGLSYNWHRVYDASTGRYTQPDPLRFVDGPSVYGYVGQSPMMRVDATGLSPLAVPALLCRIYPSLCASAGATIIYGVWNGCYWVFRKGFSGGGGGGGDDDGDECEQQLSDDEAGCSRSTKDSAMPGARSACHQRATIRFRICRENQRGASKEMPPRWTKGKDDEVWRNFGK
jgi:RHS repeat-associated protein